MKKINKTPEPNALTRFSQNNMTANWDDFKNNNGGSGYHAVCTLIFQDQGGLCAYCESKVIGLLAHKQRLEHFHPKSDGSDPGKKWALDWGNIFGVCIGGSDADKEIHPLPRNLSCDSHKDHLINRGKLLESCEGLLINPLHMPASPSLFKLDKRTGDLIPHEEICAAFVFDDNQVGSTLDLVRKTIEILNLNCDRLAKQRLAVLNEYNRLIKKARGKDDQQIHSSLASHWFQNKWPCFFTTRRFLLGKYAETYLTQVAYNG